MITTIPTNINNILPLTTNKVINIINYTTIQQFVSYVVLNEFGLSPKIIMLIIIFL
jgi:hypothetical protein